MTRAVFQTIVNGRQVTDPNIAEAIDAMVVRIKDLEHAIRFALPVIGRARQDAPHLDAALLDALVADLQAALEAGS